ncbi:MAG: glycosyltransferase family 39 protein [Deltaproteobacteria bacterium]|nr:glycosyltransferase family 39 protein [Myxococcales bacterium]MDP3218022.1 glycosyltransferase family 39 protein [Deltaproteobacteria bacterium]
MNTAAEDPRARRRERLLAWGPTGLAALVSLAVTIRAHVHFLFPYATPVSNDEGYIAALALRMIRGHWLPYVDGVSQRGPITYWLAALAMRIGGMWSWVPLRVLALVCALATMGLVFLLALELFTPAAAAIAVLASTYFFTYELNPWDGIGYNGEVPAMVFALASWLLVARAMRHVDDPRGPVRRRDAHILLAGVLASCAALSKQMALIHAVPLAAWIVLGTTDPASTRRSRARDVIRFAAGGAIPFALVVALYAATGHIREFIYYFQQYGRDIFMAPVTLNSYRDKLKEQLDKYLLGIVVVGSIGWMLAARVLRRVADHDGPRWTGLRAEAGALVAFLQLAASVVGASFTGRFFPHYLVEVFSVAAVVTGGALAASVAPARASLRGRFIGTVTVVLGVSGFLAVCSWNLSRNVRLRRETDRWYQDPHTDPIVRYVLERTDPGERIFVWGFRAETYLSSQRMPASRFVYTVYPSGVVPWFQATREEEERRVVPGSRALLLADLEREKPELIIDAGRTMSGRYMYNYPQLRAYLDRGYCFMRYVDGEPVYRRRHGDTCPPADY